MELYRVERPVSFLPDGGSFSVQHPLFRLLYFRDVGYPVFDIWLRQKLSETHMPVYITQWRSLINKLCHPSRKETDLLEKSISKYRHLFESSQIDMDAVWDCLAPIAKAIARNKISAAPTEEEIRAIAETLNIRVAPKEADKNDNTLSENPALHLLTRKGPLTIMKQGHSSPNRMVHIIHTEWLLLQCVCGQAQRELMEAVYLLFSKIKTRHEHTAQPGLRHLFCCKRLNKRSV